MKAYLYSLNKEANIYNQWDFGFLLDFLNGDLWKPPTWQNIEIVQDVTKLPKDDVAIVVIPARHHKGLEDQVNKELQRIQKVVLFLMGDEEAEFDIDKINHPNIHIWVQNPHLSKHDSFNRLGTGYPKHMKEILKKMPEPIHKDLDMYFSGQMTHQRRYELADVMIDMQSTIYSVDILATKGFTQGETPENYYKKLVSARIAPAPSGAVIPDSFRFFEALECMCIPIADEKTPDGKTHNYWDWLFNVDTPMPKVINWDRLYGLVPELIEEYPNNINQIICWWIKYKRSFAHKVMEQLNG